MPNPNPRTEFLRPYKAVGALPSEPLGDRPLAVKVGQSVLKAVMALDRPKRITWLRTVITEAAQRELMGNASQAGLDATADDVPNLGATTRTCDAAPSVQKRRGRKPRGES